MHHDPLAEDLLGAGHLLELIGRELDAGVAPGTEEEGRDAHSTPLRKRAISARVGFRSKFSRVHLLKALSL